MQNSIFIRLAKEAVNHEKDQEHRILEFNSQLCQWYTIQPWLRVLFVRYLNHSFLKLGRLKSIGRHWKITGINKCLYGSLKIHTIYPNIYSYFDQDAAVGNEFIIQPIHHFIHIHVMGLKMAQKALWAECFFISQYMNYYMKNCFKHWHWISISPDGIIYS